MLACSNSFQNKEFKKKKKKSQTIATKQALCKYSSYQDKTCVRNEEQEKGKVI